MSSRFVVTRGNSIASKGAASLQPPVFRRCIMTWSAWALSKLAEWSTDLSFQSAGGLITCELGLGFCLARRGSAFGLRRVVGFRAGALGPLTVPGAPPPGGALIVAAGLCMYAQELRKVRSRSSNRLKGLKVSLLKCATSSGVRRRKAIEKFWSRT